MYSLSPGIAAEKKDTAGAKEKPVEAKGGDRPAAPKFGPGDA